MEWEHGVWKYGSKSPSMSSVSPFISELLLLFLLSVLKISSTNLMRTSSDEASIFSLGGGGEERSWHTYTQTPIHTQSDSWGGTNFSPQHQFAEQLSSLVHLHKDTIPWHYPPSPTEYIQLSLLGSTASWVTSDLLSDSTIIPESSLVGAVEIIIDHHHLAHIELLGWCNIPYKVNEGCDVMADLAPLVAVPGPWPHMCRCELSRLIFIVTLK